MAKEEKEQVQEPIMTETEVVIEANPEEKLWMDGMEAKYPDLKGNKEALYKASREGYDKEHELNKENADTYKRIYDAMEREPKAAVFINKLTNPENEDTAIEEAILEMGDDVLDLVSGKIDMPAYREKKAAMAEEKAKADAEKMEMEKAAGEAFVGACEEIGIEPDEAYNRLKDMYGEEGKDVDFRTSKPFYVALLRSLTYEDDLLAAEARGRNAKMTERDNRKIVESDGLPRSTSGGQGAAAKRNPNSLGSIMAERAAMNR